MLHGALATFRAHGKRPSHEAEISNAQGWKFDVRADFESVTGDSAGWQALLTPIGH